MKSVLDINSSSLKLLLGVPVLEFLNSDWIFPLYFRFLVHYGSGTYGCV